MIRGTRRVRRAPVLWMLLAAAALAALLVDAHRRGDYDVTGDPYMANYPGDLAHFLEMGAVELLALALVLRPWSYHRAPGRAVLALALWVPWALFAMVVCMHCGTIGGAHGLWLLAVAAGLFVAALVSAVARRRAGQGTPS